MAAVAGAGAPEGVCLVLDSLTVRNEESERRGGAGGQGWPLCLEEKKKRPFISPFPLSLTQALRDAAPNPAAWRALRGAGLPARLGAAILAEAGVPSDTRAAELKAGEVDTLARLLGAYPLAVTGVDGGWGKAEVTAGGVPLAELEAGTLESRLAPGLHVCGELLAPAGRLGGFNFYWAWCGGRVAGIGAVGTAVRAWEAEQRERGGQIA